MGSWRRVLEAQLGLVARGLSPGSLDGVLGSQTRAALRAFQQSVAQPATGELDGPTLDRLRLAVPMLVTRGVREEDLAGLSRVGRTWLEKSQQERLGYETLLERVAEGSQSHPDLLRRLNGGVDWQNAGVGTALTVPNAQFPPPAAKAAFIRIALGQRFLQVRDGDGRLLAHYPCSIARLAAKRPVGELRVELVIANPNYTFDPRMFPESAEGRALGRKLVLPPGPNNPVGTVWIGLNKPRYGIHGTPSPELVGRAESHGCFRLANWNAEHLRSLVWVGLPVWVER
ncbi:MAG: murein L,D-transpeptidase [Verrucomicrobia bacterium]|nr:murein L,D-transpeptidase [Verrucomicrobiota bacterium]